LNSVAGRSAFGLRFAVNSPEVGRSCRRDLLEPDVITEQSDGEAGLGP
jgi:hypothetical protein